jgi:hypothetical protein
MRKMNRFHLLVLHGRTRFELRQGQKENSEALQNSGQLIFLNEIGWFFLQHKAL